MMEYAAFCQQTEWWFRLICPTCTPTWNTQRLSLVVLSFFYSSHCTERPQQIAPGVRRPKQLIHSNRTGMTINANIIYHLEIGLIVYGINYQVFFFKYIFTKLLNIFLHSCLSCTAFFHHFTMCTTTAVCQYTSQIYLNKLLYYKLQISVDLTIQQ